MSCNKNGSALKFRLPIQIVAECLDVRHAVQMKIAVHWIAGFWVRSMHCNTWEYVIALSFCFRSLLCVMHEMQMITAIH